MEILDRMHTCVQYWYHMGHRAALCLSWQAAATMLSLNTVFSYLL